MQEQQRAAKSKVSGEKKIKNNKWTKMTADFMQSLSQKSDGKKLKAIDDKKQELIERSINLRLPEIIKPKFCIAADTVTDTAIVAINDGCISYTNQTVIVSGINLAINSKDRIAILGNNGSGKSTLIKAILQHNNIIKNGDWFLPNLEDIGYLDQH
jgi:ATPase subunit of ABC transporter with duplicated ATPase domains